MTKPARSSLVFWGFLVCLVGLTWLRIDLHKGGTPLIEAAGAQEPALIPEMGVVVPLASQNPAPVIPAVSEPSLPVQRVIHDTLGSDGSIYLSLKEHDISELQIARLGNALEGDAAEPIFDAQRFSRPGDSFILTLDSLDAVVRFEYTPALSPERPILVVREGDQLVAERSERELARLTRVLHVVIEDNLVLVVIVKID